MENFNRQVLYIKQRTPVSAFQIAEVMKQFGDIYVVKDSTTACFVEFQYIVDEATNCPGGDVGETDAATQEMRLRHIIQTVLDRQAEIFPHLEVICSYRDCLSLREQVLL